jgi:hypothetical protein
MVEDWGPWFDHDGRGCPCPGRMAHVVLGIAVDICPDGVQIFDPGRDPGIWDASVIEVISDYEAIVIAEDGGSWSWSPESYPIVRYRIRRPDAVRQLVGLVEGMRDRLPVEAA